MKGRVGAGEEGKYNTYQVPGFRWEEDGVGKVKIKGARVPKNRGQDRSCVVTPKVRRWASNDDAYCSAPRIIILLL